MWPLGSLVESVSAGQPWWLTQMNGEGLEEKTNRVSRNEPICVWRRGGGNGVRWEGRFLQAGCYRTVSRDRNGGEQ